MSKLLPTILALAGCAELTAVTEVDGLEVITVRRAYGNVHAVPAGSGYVLVDAGLEAEADALVDDLERAGLDPSAVALVVLTHGHADHAGGAARLRELTGARVVAGAGDADLLAEGRNDRLCPTDATARDRLDAAQAETYDPVEADVLVPEGTSLDLTAFGLDGVITATPGHTPGSLVLQVGRAVFGGDLLRGEILGGAAATHFYQCDLPGNRAEVARVHEVLAPDATTWFVGHFGPLSREAVSAWLAAHP